MSARQRAAIKAATLAAQAAVVNLDAQSIASLIEAYQQAADDVKARISASADAQGYVPLGDLQSVLAQIQGRLNQLSQARDGLLGTAMEAAARLGVSPMVGEVLDNATAMVVAHDALVQAKGFVAADGLQLSDRLWRLDQGVKQIIAQEVEQAVIQGQSAVQAARSLLSRGQAVGDALSTKASLAKAEDVARNAAAALTDTPMADALRVMRTEINRAHGEAYMAAGAQTQGFAGWRYMLSPAHPRPDICDLLSTQNLYGLGAGVYPSREKCPWPAHPNILSFVQIVFEDEVSDADKAGKETPMEALKRLPEETQRGVLGAGKLAIFNAGDLRQGMIRSRLRDVKRRLR